MKLSSIDLKQYCGAYCTTLDEIRNLPKPKGSPTWKPVAHIDLIDLVKDELRVQGILVDQEQYATHKGGDWMFGMMQLHGVSRYEDVRSIVACVRQSYDKTFAAGMLVAEYSKLTGSLSFVGDIDVVRRNTRNVQSEIPFLVSEAVAKLVDSISVADDRLEAYMSTMLDDPEVAHLIFILHDEGVLSKTKVVDTWVEWTRSRNVYLMMEKPSVWKFQNCVLESLKGLDLFKYPKLTEKMYHVLDRVAGFEREI